MNDLRVAVVVMRSGFGEIERNLARMEHFAGQAAEQEVDVVCFPEMSITGYALKEEVVEYAEPAPGPSTNEVQHMSSRHNVAILAGLAEKTDGNGIAITQVVALPDGSMSTYRKLHLSLGEQAFFQAGCDIPLFRYEETMFGVQLCYDAHFPELSSIMALKGAEVIFMPHASPPPESADEKKNRWLRYLAARAYDNSVFVIACNQTGDGGAGIRFAGVALALDPRGEIIAETSDAEERMIVAELKSDLLRKTRETRMGFFLAHRRPELYSGLVAPMAESLLEGSHGSNCFFEEKPPGGAVKARKASNS
jgi:predicted amidohydrolase